jgi:hypothetical protein
VERHHGWRTNLHDDSITDIDIDTGKHRTNGGTLSVARTQSGLTAGTTYGVRFAWRRIDVGGTAKNVTAIGTLHGERLMTWAKATNIATGEVHYDSTPEALDPDVYTIELLDGEPVEHACERRSGQARRKDQGQDTRRAQPVPFLKEERARPVRGEFHDGR